MRRLHFKYCRSYRIFEREVRQKSRFIHAKQGEKFLEIVLETSEQFAETIPCGSKFWRAQIGLDEKKSKRDKLFVHPPYRMKPRRGKAPEGRANPKGIPYLYLAEKGETAIAEVRPWVGSYVSVSKFRICKDIKVINFTGAKFESQKYQHLEIPPWDLMYRKEPEPAVRNDIVWVDINNAFAKPVTPNDELADYAPTQIIAEYLKEANIDGIVYKSSLGPGSNIALFDLNAAKVVDEVILQKVVAIKIKFSDIG